MCRIRLFSVTLFTLSDLLYFLRTIIHISLSLSPGTVARCCFPCRISVSGAVGANASAGCSCLCSRFRASEVFAFAEVMPCRCQ